jgi:hypothetical protein
VIIWVHRSFNIFYYYCSSVHFESYFGIGKHDGTRLFEAFPIIIYRQSVRLIQDLR